MQTKYDFTLPRGYVDAHGTVHRTGTMRLATARDELEPLRDPMIDGPDDPRLTVVVLARVVERLGTMELVTARDIEGLFAVDLAFLQDFYGVINFGSQAEYEELMAAQSASSGPVTAAPALDAPAAAEEPSPAAPSADDPASGRVSSDVAYVRPGRSAIEEIPTDGR
ncbi:hypothetical protein [Cellulomonas chengniuliangii]|uniref:hypothetical protein n=1 Tax=Cellulomonas chengniuliangii TaxID=2968084 RepID=UPI001D0EC3FD|nr:hypothetical protein [Cellulomonas chengniuliangii]MCC2317631.1 hypothetical protein [Cellulomonas chengniuliangii]